MPKDHLASCFPTWRVANYSPGCLLTLLRLLTPISHLCFQKSVRFRSRGCDNLQRVLPTWLGHNKPCHRRYGDGCKNPSRGLLRRFALDSQLWKSCDLFLWMGDSKVPEIGFSFPWFKRKDKIHEDSWFMIICGANQREYLQKFTQLSPVEKKICIKSIFFGKKGWHWQDHESPQLKLFFSPKSFPFSQTRRMFLNWWFLPIPSPRSAHIVGLDADLYPIWHFEL